MKNEATQAKKPATDKGPPARDRSITFTKSQLVAAFLIWNQDEREGRCAAIADPQKHAERSADSMLDYIKAATAA